MAKITKDWIIKYCDVHKAKHAKAIKYNCGVISNNSNESVIALAKRDVTRRAGAIKQLDLLKFTVIQHT